MACADLRPMLDNYPLRSAIKRSPRLGVESSWSRESRGALRTGLSAGSLVACRALGPGVAARSLGAWVSRRALLAGSPGSSVVTGQTIGPVLSVGTCVLSPSRQEASNPKGSITFTLQSAASRDNKRHGATYRVLQANRAPHALQAGRAVRASLEDPEGLQCPGSQQYPLVQSCLCAPSCPVGPVLLYIPCNPAGQCLREHLRALAVLGYR